MERSNCLRMINEIADIHEEYDALRNKALYSGMSPGEIAEAILEITEGETRALRRVSDKCGASCTLSAIRKPVAVPCVESNSFWSTAVWSEKACKADAMTGQCVVPLSGDPMIAQILAEAAQVQRRDETGMRWA